VFRAHRAAPPRRPWSLTVLCLGGGLLLLWSTWHALGGSPARAFGPGYWLYLAATNGGLGVALWGLWRLRRWALWAFPLALLLDTAVVALMGELRKDVLGVELLLVLLVLSQHRAFPRTPRPGA
jgi:hypothetical protein